MMNKINLIKLTDSAFVLVQFYPWFNFYFPLFLCMVMYDNEY